jgi:hypothetical protein
VGVGGCRACSGRQWARSRVEGQPRTSWRSGPSRRGSRRRRSRVHDSRTCGWLAIVYAAQGRVGHGVRGVGEGRGGRGTRGGKPGRRGQPWRVGRSACNIPDFP